MNNNLPIKALVWGRSMRRTAYGIMDAFLRLREPFAPEVNVLNNINRALPQVMAISVIPPIPAAFAINEWWNTVGHPNFLIRNTWDAERLARLCVTALGLGIKVCRIEEKPLYIENLRAVFGNYRELDNISIVLIQPPSQPRGGWWIEVGDNISCERHAHITNWIVHPNQRLNF